MTDTHNFATSEAPSASNGLALTDRPLSPVHPRPNGTVGPVGDRPLVVIPTYNEAENIEPLVVNTLRAAPDADVLIVDDNSPDGTGEIGARMANRLEAVHILHRPEKQGIGSAYVEGFNWALNRGYPAVVQIDADGSHRPDEVPRLLKALQLADVALGSRWVRCARAARIPSTNT